MKSSRVVDCDDSNDVVGRESIWNRRMSGLSKFVSKEIGHDCGQSG
jgi:hypothetical protein